MSYQRYLARVGERRALLLAQLTKANDLRLEAQLPTWDVEQLLQEQVPMLTKEEYASRSKGRAGFQRFRRKQLAKTHLPDPAQATHWQEERARVMRRAFVEQQIEKLWEERTKLLLPSDSL